jgi:hypothetical protein
MAACRPVRFPTAAILARSNQNQRTSSAEPASVYDFTANAAMAAARTIGRKIPVLNPATEGDFHTGFARLAQGAAGALVVGSDLFFVTGAVKS